jgi:hypothetical protein
MARLMATCPPPRSTSICAILLGAELGVQQQLGAWRYINSNSHLLESSYRLRWKPALLRQQSTTHLIVHNTGCTARLR